MARSLSPHHSRFNITTILRHTEGSVTIQHTYKSEVSINASVSITTITGIQSRASGKDIIYEGAQLPLFNHILATDKVRPSSE